MNDSIDRLTEKFANMLSGHPESLDTIAVTIITVSALKAEMFQFVTREMATIKAAGRAPAAAVAVAPA